MQPHLIMLVSFSDGKPSQYQRIHELLLTYYPLWRDEFIAEPNAALEQALLDKQDPVHQEKWVAFLSSVKLRAKGVVRLSPTVLGTFNVPALGGVFTLSREKIGRTVYKRKFEVYLSLLGGFYTMFGRDEVYIEATGQPDAAKNEVRFEPVLYPSPYAIYERWFWLLKEMMEETYADYEFVPHRTLCCRLVDISTGYSGTEGRAQSLFQALFSGEDINPYLTCTDNQIHPFEQGESG